MAPKDYPSSLRDWITYLLIREGSSTACERVNEKSAKEKCNLAVILFVNHWQWYSASFRESFIITEICERIVSELTNFPPILNGKKWFVHVQKNENEHSLTFKESIPTRDESLGFQKHVQSMLDDEMKKELYLQALHDTVENGAPMDTNTIMYWMSDPNAAKMIMFQQIMSAAGDDTEFKKKMESNSEIMSAKEQLQTKWTELRELGHQIKRLKRIQEDVSKGITPQEVPSLKEAAAMTVLEKSRELLQQAADRFAREQAGEAALKRQREADKAADKAAGKAAGKAVLKRQHKAGEQASNVVKKKRGR